MTDIARERQLLFAQGLGIVTREAAGARYDYTSARRVDEPARWAFLHITVTDDPADTPEAEAAAWRIVEAIGQERFDIGFSYNAGAMQSGRLYEGQPLTRRGAHTVDNKATFGVKDASLNYGGRAVALVQDVEDAVTEGQIDACARWAAAQKRSGLMLRDAPWYGHRDFAWKSCPGDKGYAWLPELRNRTEHYTINGLGNGSRPEPLEDYKMPYPVIFCRDRGPTFWALTEEGPKALPGGKDAYEWYQQGVAAKVLQPVQDLSGQIRKFDVRYSLCRDLALTPAGK